MSGMDLSAIAAALKSRDVVTAQDVLELRRASYRDGAISVDEAEALMQIEAAVPSKSLEWNLYYVEAITDFIVHQAKPAGYVTDENAKWLIDHVEADGRIHSATELELLIKVLEAARYCPLNLTTFCLAQIKDAVLNGAGPLRSGSDLEPGVIGASEVELLRRVLYAAGGQGNVAITVAEAELLFDINDAVKNADNVPAWSDLFIKAIANHIMALSGYKVPPREEALRLEEWLDEPISSGMGSFFGRMVSGGFRGIIDSYKEETAEDRAMARLEATYREMLTNEKVDSAEADWVKARISRDGTLHENERLLLEFLKQESPDVCPSLHELLDAAA